MDKSSLGHRMKGYEYTAKTKLQRRTPVIIRLDGKAFHTWTKQLKRCDGSLKTEPFSALMHALMLSTSKYLMDNIQNAVLSYSQSDEISILLNDWKQLKTDQWFGANVQKMVSISASLATARFNSLDAIKHYGLSLALFDARVFNLPKEEVANYFLWRQQDATRNSIQMVGQFHFSHKEMHCKNVSQIQDMLMLDKGVNWNDIDTWKKRGFCVTKEGYDNEIPIFSKDRNFIEQYLGENDV